MVKDDISGILDEPQSKNASKRKDGASKSSSLPSQDLVRFSIVMRKTHHDKLQATAFWTDTSMKDVLDRILEQFFSGKKIDPIPKKRNITAFFEKE